MINLARSRGRGVRFTLHAEGRVADCRINRAYVAAAKASDRRTDFRPHRRPRG